ncbi:MAG: S24 family peptidase [Rubrivivax sp.]|nr:MAG: S24 family peptidase [Rubrivivax sp.]
MQRRVALLQALLDGPFQGNKAELGRRLGYKDGSLIGQFLREDRPLTEATELKMLSLPESRRIASNDSAQTLVAQSVSQAVANLPSTTSWEAVMDREKMPIWPDEITVIVPDRALEPHVMSGDHVTFEACSEAEPTSVVVLEIEDGSRWIRRLVRRADGSLWGAATKDAFPEFPATKILARAVRRSSPFNGF